ncbi:MAG TPA: MOSC N-terminal beta barrel domain-containing protein [Ilumatobacter sp.]|nr:MOSC N-terminal beta barrel domain-containing protein [Ilumatobacter sp.]
MRVSQLWRYPIKSLAGEPLERADVGPLGISGDRQFGLVDRTTGLVLTARRVPELLFATPTTAGGQAAIELPDGTVTADDRALSEWLGRRVTLAAATPDRHGTYEIAVDDGDPGSEWIRWDGPDGVFHDSGRTRLSIVAEPALGDWDVRRFRPNVVVSGGDERDLLGRQIRIGEVLADVVKEIDRCVIVTRPQPALARDLDVLRTVARERSGNLGVGALVVEPGSIAIGDPVELVA